MSSINNDININHNMADFFNDSGFYDVMTRLIVVILSIKKKDNNEIKNDFNNHNINKMSCI